ncbi:hypothetical protein C9975_05635 [Thalassospira xiamenensis]|nr:hypothetical protein C9975_05635 [Thalassospira xiamenensis]
MKGSPSLWEHQRIAISTSVAYLCGEKSLPERIEHKEAALLKLPTGTGKSGIVSVLARCLPNVTKVLILTPRTALVEQLISDIRCRFWKHMGYPVPETDLFLGSSDMTGNALDSAYINQLLPSRVLQVNAHLRDEEAGRVILVGTHQALGAIRNGAYDPDEPNESYRLILSEIKNSFDLVIVDEAHYEPAISWSRGVRDFNLPTILMSATPYRNDYKSFRVRGRYLFNFPYHQAVKRKIVRPIEVIIPNTEPEKSGEPAVVQFVQMLKLELGDRLKQATAWFGKSEAPKVMVRGDDVDTLNLLQSQINLVFETRSVVIHERAKKTQENQDRFTSVASALLNRPEATFWIHQNKLMEGIDDSTFIAVGIFDLMSNARQLIQQIGRVTRYSKGDRRYRQTAWVLASSLNAVRIEKIWERYQGYEDYAARQTSHIVTNEVTLPDRLLENMAEYQYISGEFRGRFDFEKALSADDIQLKLNAVVLISKEQQLDIRHLSSSIEEAMMDRDRFKVTPIDNMPGDSVGFSYYAWKNSPYLIDRFFSEWKLGIFIAIKHEGFIFMHDTEGLVINMSDLKLQRANRSLMEKAFSKHEEGDNVRLSRMSFSSLDLSESAIRGLAMRTRSFDDVFTDLLEPSLVPSTAAGFVNGIARYVGFARSRLRDASEQYVPMHKYLDWTKSVFSELSDVERSRSRVFERYAAIIENITTEEAQPVSILIAPSLDDTEDDDAGVAAFMLQDDISYFDVCADVDEKTGEFFIEINDKKIKCALTYVEEKRKYRIESDELNELFPSSKTDERGQRKSILQRLNQRQSFRILTCKEGVVYSEGNFYKPRLRWVLEDNSKPILDYIYSCSSLKMVDSEKGEIYFSKNELDWHRKSIFGLFHKICKSENDSDQIDNDRLANAIKAFPIWLCDDDGREVADFIGLDPDAKKIVFVHAKVGIMSSKGSGYNVGALQEVGRQVLGSLGFMSLGSHSPYWTPERWRSSVQANKVSLTKCSRIFEIMGNIRRKRLIQFFTPHVRIRLLIRKFG